MWWHLTPCVRNLDAGLFAEYTEERVPELGGDAAGWHQDAEPGATADGGA
jgi:hypothetical protein